MQDVVITGASRTAMGGFQGIFGDTSAAQLGGAAIRAALAQAGKPAVDELLMGCVLPAGQGQAPARQAGFAAGLGEEVPATTVNKMCGSGMKTAMMAWDRLALGAADVIVAGGMESMSQAPYLLPKMRGGARLGHAQVIDHMFLDGLEDAYDRGEGNGGRLMGTFAEDCAEAYQFTREALDLSLIHISEPTTSTRWPRCRTRSRPNAATPSRTRSPPSPCTPGPAKRSSPAMNSPAAPGPRKSRISSPPSARTAR